jgi:hypothetical protein
VGEKITWLGILAAVQPHIALTRSFDQPSHSYLGYVLRLNGTVADENREFVFLWAKAWDKMICVTVPSLSHPAPRGGDVPRTSVDARLVRLPVSSGRLPFGR